MTPADKTKQIIDEICAKHKVKADDFMIADKKCNRVQSKAFREICKSLYEAGWGLSKIARLTHRNHSTIVYHLKS